MLRFLVTPCHFNWCNSKNCKKKLKKKKKIGHIAKLMTGPSVCAMNFVIVFSRAPLMYLSVMTFFKGIHFYSKKKIPLSFSCLLKVPIKTFADVRFDQSLASWLGSGGRGADGRSKFKRGTCAKWEITEERGTSSRHCQHLIGSGIKHFVNVEAEERGRAGGGECCFVPRVRRRGTNLAQRWLKRSFVGSNPAQKFSWSIKVSLIPVFCVSSISMRDGLGDSCNKNDHCSP